MPRTLTIDVTLEPGCIPAERESRTTRLLQHAVALAQDLASLAENTRPALVTINAYDGTATVRFTSDTDPAPEHLHIAYGSSTPAPAPPPTQDEVS